MGPALSGPPAAEPEADMSLLSAGDPVLSPDPVYRDGRPVSWEVQHGRVVSDRRADVREDGGTGATFKTFNDLMMFNNSSSQIQRLCFHRIFVKKII